MLNIPREMTPFQELLFCSLTNIELEELIEQLGSKSKFTRIIKKPSRASNDELLLFSSLLGVPAYVLHERYTLGADKVTSRELAQHRLIAKHLQTPA